MRFESDDKMSSLLARSTVDYSKPTVINRHFFGCVKRGGKRKPGLPTPTWSEQDANDDGAKSPETFSFGATVAHPCVRNSKTRDSYPCKRAKSFSASKKSERAHCVNDFSNAAYEWKRRSDVASAVTLSLCVRLRPSDYYRTRHLHNTVNDVLRESGSLRRGSDFPKWKCIAETVSRPPWSRLNARRGCRRHLLRKSGVGLPAPPRSAAPPTGAAERPGIMEKARPDADLDERTGFWCVDRFISGRRYRSINNSVFCFFGFINTTVLCPRRR
jgi:hypothetical protein